MHVLALPVHPPPLKPANVDPAAAAAVSEAEVPIVARDTVSARLGPRSTTASVTTPK